MRIATKLAALCVLATVATACDWNPFGTHIGTVVNVGQTVTQTQGGGSTPGTSASPSPSSGVPQQVRVGQFSDERCPSGVQPASEVRTVRAGCLQPITCTPLLTGGVDAVTPLGITTPDSFSITAGSSGTLEATEEPFNRDFRAGPLAGPVTITCTVRGVSGTLDLVVIQ